MQTTMLCTSAVFSATPSRPEPPRRDVQLPDGGPTRRQQPLLERRVRPGAGDDPRAVRLAHAGQLLPPFPELVGGDAAAGEQGRGEGVQQPMGIGELGVEHRQALGATSRSPVRASAMRKNGS